MDLVDRYVNEVGRRLPKGQRQEIRRELRSALLDSIEHSNGGGEQSAGPTEAQVVEALVQLGPPERVAASYRPADQYLIGPELYPDFKRVLGLVLTVLLALLVASFALGLVSQSAGSGDLGGRLLGLVGGFLDAGWVVFAIIVLIFAGLQRLEVRPGRDTREWDPRQLPAVRDADLVGRGEMAIGIVVAGIFLALLHVFKDAIGVVVEPGGKLLLNDVLVRYLPWASAVLLLGMALHAYLFWRGRWDWATRIIDLGIDAGGLVVLYRIVVSIAAQKGALEAELPAPVPMMLVQMGWSVFVVVLGFVLWQAGKVVWWAVGRR